MSEFLNIDSQQSKSAKSSIIQHVGVSKKVILMRIYASIISASLWTCFALNPSMAQPTDYEWVADACRNKSKVATHPIFHISDASQLKTEKLDTATFKVLNDIYLEPDSTDYWRSDMANIEEKALNSGKLGELLIGKTSEEVVNLIGPPRITTGSIEGWHESITGQVNAVYFMGYQPTGVCITYSKNICKAAEAIKFKDLEPMEHAAFVAARKFALGKSGDEISKYLRHELKESSIEGLDSASFDVGESWNWEFHFTRGKCDGVSELVTLH